MCMTNFLVAKTLFVLVEIEASLLKCKRSCQRLVELGEEIEFNDKPSFFTF